MKEYNVIDLFAGVGGLSYGFSEMPEFHILAANEIERDIAAAYSLNHPGVTMLNCDICALTESALLEATGRQQIDIVIGRPASPIPRWAKDGWTKKPACFCSTNGSFSF